ncbi:MAG: hypothetical protein ACE37H_02985 [Phycisphaeraceae bacterium]
MTDGHGKHTLPVLLTDLAGRCFWSDRHWPTHDRGGMRLTGRVGCSSLRLRSSAPGYATDWHGAGEPVLVLVRRGVLRIELRDGSARDFGPGDAFIAADAAVQSGDALIPEGCPEGHRARVIGDAPLEAVHVKLDPAGLNSDR